MSHHPRRTRGKCLALVLAGAGLNVLAGCSDSPTTTSDPDPEAAVHFQRLVVADAEQATVRVYGMADDQQLATFQLDAPASYVFSSGSGRFAGVQQRTADRVHFVDGGVWVHHDHGHRHSPSLLAFALNDGLPTHANVNGEWMTTFFDGSGRAAWVREGDLVQNQGQVAFELQTGGPHHSGSVTVLSQNSAYFGVAPLNPAGGLPSSVEVYSQQGQLLATVPDCPVMHGNAAAGNTAVFGCNNGFALILAGGSGVAASKVTPTGALAGLGLRNAWSANGSNVILGQFSALPGQPTQRVLATIEVGTGALHPLAALPAGVVDHFRVIEPVKRQIVLLGTDGALYIYAASTRQLERTVGSVVPPIPTSGAVTHQVSVVEDLAAVASPSTGEVVLVNLATGSVIRRVNVGGKPSRLAILGAQENGLYELED